MTDELVYKTERRLTDIENKLTFTKGEEGQTTQESGITDTLYIKQKKNDDLLHGTGSYVQYYVIT